MNERYLEILAQYDLTVESLRKGRSGYVCETSAGTVLLSPDSRRCSAGEVGIQRDAETPGI